MTTRTGGSLCSVFRWYPIKHPVTHPINTHPINTTIIHTLSTPYDTPSINTLFQHSMTRPTHTLLPHPLLTPPPSTSSPSVPSARSPRLQVPPQAAVATTPTTPPFEEHRQASKSADRDRGRVRSRDGAEVGK